MKKIYLQILTIVLAFVFIFGAGGVYAAWAYAEGDVDSTGVNLGVGMYVWTDRPEDNQGDMSLEETTVTNNLTDILTDVLGSGTSSPEAEEFNNIIDDRKADRGSSWYAPKEVGIDDPEAEALRRLLGIEDDSSLSAIIKFTDDAVGYELYTTRVNVNAKDSNGNYVFADDDVDAETHYIYPVNKTTFTKKSDGTVVADTISVGYSRVIWYYETASQKSDTIRSFDVSQWATGASADANNAIKVEKTGELFIHSDIGQVGNTNETAVYFRRANWSGYGYSYTNFATSGLSAASVDASIADGSYSFVRGVNGSNQYAKLTYTPGSKNPSATNANVIRFTC